MAASLDLSALTDIFDAKFLCFTGFPTDVAPQFLLKLTFHLTHIPTTNQHILKKGAAHSRRNDEGCLRMSVLFEDDNSKDE